MCFSDFGPADQHSGGKGGKGKGGQNGKGKGEGKGKGKGKGSPGEPWQRPAPRENAGPGVYRATKVSKMQLLLLSFNIFKICIKLLHFIWRYMYAIVKNAWPKIFFLLILDF